MKGWLVDTNVVSELRKPQCHQGVTEFHNGQPLHLIYTADVIFAEIRFGITKQSSKPRRRQLGAWLDNTLRPWFGDRVLGADEETWVIWKSKVELGRSRRRTFPEPDLVIAAIAERHGLIAVSRDIDPFVRSCTAVLDPWRKEYIAANGDRRQFLTFADADLCRSL